MPRPHVFIGSSTEGLAIAQAIQVNLDHDCEAELWTQGIFGLSEGTLEALVDKAPTFDFAILVLTPDDLTHSREEQRPSPRDNVLLELGMFIGFLGRKRTFIVYDRTAGLKLPTDLAGVTPATYQPHTTGNHTASLGAPCTSIKNTIRELGVIDRQSLATLDESSQFQIITDLLELAVQQFLILAHLDNIVFQREGPYARGIDYEYEMEGGKQSGNGYFSINELCQLLPDANLLQQDLRGRVTLTPRGRNYADWLITHNYKAAFFASKLGGWGEPSPEMAERYRRSREAAARKTAIGELPSSEPPAAQ